MSNKNESEILLEDAQRCALNSVAYSQAKCSEGELCYMMCSVENCKINAVLCGKNKCKCRQKHKEYHREIKKRAMETIDPKEICLEIMEKNSASFKHLEAWLNEEIEDFIRWAQEFKGHICERIAGLAPNEQQRKFLQLGYTKEKIDELTGSIVFKVVESLESSNLDSDERFAKKIEKDIKDKWGEIITPVRNLKEYFEKVLNKSVENKLEKKKDEKVEESSEEEEFDEHIIKVENEDIQGDLKDYLLIKDIKNPTELYLKGNEFKYATIENASLKYLDLSNNKIESIHFKSFQLKMLNLENNLIKDIKELAKTHLPYLEELNIQRNQIKELPKFAKMPQLKQAEFGWNELENLEDFSNSKLSNLSILYMESNKIKSLEWFVQLLPNVKRLKIIFLNGNRIEELPNLNVLEHHRVKLSIFIKETNKIIESETGGIIGFFLEFLDPYKMFSMFKGETEGVTSHFEKCSEFLKEIPESSNMYGKGCPISKYSEFLKTTPAAFEMINIMMFSLTASNEKEFNQKEEEFRFIGNLAIIIKWFEETEKMKQEKMKNQKLLSSENEENLFKIIKKFI